MADRIRSAAAGIPSLAPLLRQTDPERDATSRRLIARALTDGEWDAYWSDIRTQAAGYAMADIPFSVWVEVISMLRTEAAAIVEDAFRDDEARRTGARIALDLWLDGALGVFGDVFTSTMGDVIHRQQEAIRELSTPVLQVRPQLLIVPVVGVLDAVRLTQMETEVLAAVRGRRARVVVLDVTGVPSLEPQMAERLVRTVVGVRLMGAEVIVSGLSAALAQALVSEGAELAALRSVGDLQSGIEAAEALLRDHRSAPSSSSSARLRSAPPP
jgi:anti-anti-sigma regulatory factor